MRTASVPSTTETRHMTTAEIRTAMRRGASWKIDQDREHTLEVAEAAGIKLRCEMATTPATGLVLVSMQLDLQPEDREYVPIVLTEMIDVARLDEPGKRDYWRCILTLDGDLVPAEARYDNDTMEPLTPEDPHYVPIVLARILERYASAMTQDDRLKAARCLLGLDPELDVREIVSDR